MKRNLFTLMLSVLLVGALAVPASAGIEIGTSAFTGTAEVGDQFAAGHGPNIPQSGNCDLLDTSKGLHYPGFGGPQKQRDKSGVFQVNKQVYYHFQLNDVRLAWLNTNNPTGSGLYTGGVGSTHICGIVSPGPLGIGAAAGSSTGHDGRGKIVVTGPKGTLHFDLQEVAWPPTLGGVLPAYGLITRTSADKATKFSAKGTFQSLVQAGPANPPDGLAAKPGGARTFNVRGVIVAAALGKLPAGKPNQPKLKD